MPPKFKAGEVIVRYAPGAKAATKRAANRQAGAKRVTKLGRVVPGLAKGKLKKGVTVEEAVAAYNKQPGVLYAEPNYRGTIDMVPDDPMANNWIRDTNGSRMMRPSGTFLALRLPTDTLKSSIGVCKLGYDWVKKFTPPILDCDGPDWIGGYDFGHFGFAETDFPRGKDRPGYGRFDE